MAGNPDDDERRNPTPLVHVDSYDEPFPELLEEGYARDDAAAAEVTALPDFWEVRQGQDGYTYYIDHIGFRVIKKHT